MDENLKEKKEEEKKKERIYFKKPRTLHFIVLALLLFLTIFSYFFLDKFSIPKSKVLDFLFSPLKENYSYFFIAIFVFLAFSFFSRKYKARLTKEIFALVITIFIGFILKQFIHRTRPIPSITSMTSDYSFPSNHSATMFSLAPFFKKWHYIVWLLLSISIALSRVYWNYHYFSDIFAGAFLGYLIATILISIKYEKI